MIARFKEWLRLLSPKKAKFWDKYIFPPFFALNTQKSLMHQSGCHNVLSCILIKSVACPFLVTQSLYPNVLPKPWAEESTFLSTVQQVSKSLLWYMKSIVHSDLLYNQRVVLLSCKLNNFGECVPQMMCHEKIVKSLYFLWNLKNFKTVLVSYQICDKAKSNSCRCVLNNTPSVLGFFSGVTQESCCIDLKLLCKVILLYYIVLLLPGFNWLDFIHK